MNTTTVRISKRSQLILKEIAERQGSSIQFVLEQAIEIYRRQRLFEEADAAYAALWSDPKKAEAEREERRLLEGTLMDGLDATEVWHADGTVEHRQPAADSHGQ